MPTFEATDPQGIKITFSAPEGATPEQVNGIAQQAYSARQSRLAATRAEMTKPGGIADPTAESDNFSQLDKVIANYGAGTDNLIEGVKGIFTNDSPEKDAELKEKRARDDLLAERTTGGRLLQIAGEAAPTLVIPAGGLAGGAGKLAAQTVGRVLPRATAALGGAVNPLLVDSMLAGGLAGGVAPVTSDESRLGNAAVGAALGGALPGLGIVGRQVASRLPLPGSGNRAAAELIGNQIAGAGAPSADVVSRAKQVAEQLRASRAGGAADDLPLSVAAQLQDPNLAWLEVGSRARNAGNWAGLDNRFSQGLADKLESATSEAGDLSNRYATRGQNWDANMAALSEHTDPGNLSEGIAGLYDTINAGRQSASAANPKVKALYDALENDLGRFDELTPEHLQTIRANFNEIAPHGVNPNAYQAAPRNSQAVKDIIGQLDQTLNDASGGRFSNVLKGYTEDTARVNEAKAAGQLRENFYTPGGAIRGTASGIAGDLPTLSEAGFSRAAARGEANYSPQAAQQVEQIANALRSQNIVQRIKKTGTAGGGSATAPTGFAAQDAGNLGDWALNATPGIIGKGAQAASNLANFQRNKIVAEALQNPQRMIDLLERVAKSGQELSPVQDYLLRTLRAGNANLGAGARP